MRLLVLSGEKMSDDYYVFGLVVAQWTLWLIRFRLHLGANSISVRHHGMAHFDFSSQVSVN